MKLVVEPLSKRKVQTPEDEILEKFSIHYAAEGDDLLHRKFVNLNLPRVIACRMYAAFYKIVKKSKV